MIPITQFSFLIFFVGTKILPLTNFVSLQQINSAPCWKEECQLAPSPLISTNLFSLLHVVDAKSAPRAKHTASRRSWLNTRVESEACQSIFLKLTKDEKHLDKNLELAG
jgi:hypothetical protein